ncbi:hypothetical protein N7471_011888 [Penicillium samsonianum]|uniref:uncharacterized protein n=1 Tax=Penicillium samsonianum TaxID=1882272 RepID=UPI002546C14E|nr:uncharacterized protein N7471_011888 [Penicillium samsonianum]KAJ6124571.1 hypothetical protein N7471_011888 [Penicillium samsonianum]
MAINTNPVLPVGNDTKSAITADKSPNLTPEEQEWLLGHLQGCVHPASQLKEQRFSISPAPLAWYTRPGGG